MRRLRGQRLPLRGAGAERLRGVAAPMASRKFSACAEGASAPPPSGRHTSPSRFACHLPSRGGFEARRLRKRLPLRGAGAERLRGVTAPMASRKVSACARGASAPPPSGRHTSPSRFACHLPSRGGFEARRLRKRLPLRGAVSRRLTERCYRTNGFPQSLDVCRGRFRAAAAARRHTSPSRFACHLPSRGGLGVRRIRERLPSRGAVSSPQKNQAPLGA